METSAGTINLKLYNDRAPDTVANFVKLVEKGYYDGLHFHRVIPNFMLKEDALIPQTLTQTERGLEGPDGASDVKSPH